MTCTFSSTCPIVDPTAIQQLAQVSGPCITIQIPDHQRGAQQGSRHAILRDLLREARERAADLLGPIEEMIRSGEIDSNGPGLAIFRAPDFMAHYSAPSTNRETVVIGDHFHLTPLIARAFAPQHLFVLGLSKKHLRLFKYASGECSERPLPTGVAMSLEIAGEFDQGNFFRLVDEGLKPALHGKPLLLMGVREEIRAYRRTATYPRILNHEVDGNVDHLSLSQIADCAADAAQTDYFEAGEKVLADYAEMPDRARTLSDALGILEAASAGRVHRLCFCTDQPDDLINEAVVETLRNGGEVFALPQDRMLADTPMAAILRY